MQHLIPLSGQRVAVLRRANVRVLEGLLKTRSTETLMTLAGLAAARLALAMAPHAQRIWIAAGRGNNAGDGLQAACFLHQWGLPVRVSLMVPPQQLPMDAHAAWQSAEAAGVTIEQMPPDQWLGLMTAQDLCIDALLGIGANRPPSPDMASWIERLNQSPAPVLALDVPSGLDADSGQLWGSMLDTRQVVHATATLTYLAAKPGLFMGHGRDVCGDIWLEPLTSACAEDAPESAPDAWLNPPTLHGRNAHASHKGSHGDVAVVGGESMHSNGMGMSGAAVLAAEAALHAGSGRVILSLLGERCEHPCAPADVMQRIFTQLDLSQLTVVAGCGGGQAIVQVLSAVLQSSARLVLDADGLNAVASNLALSALLRSRGNKDGKYPTVITPHPLEAARLLGCTTQQVQQDRLQAAQTLCEQLQCTVILKGSGSVIASPGQVPRINTSGNGLLAIGGTGDVLAGLIGARLAQGMSAHDAACAATWQHGAAANQWPEHTALTASRLACSLY